MAKSNGHKPLTADDLAALKPLTAGDYYWAKTNGPKDGDGNVEAEDFAFHALAHAAFRKGLVDTEGVFAFLDRVELPALMELAGEMTKELTQEGPLPTTPTTTSRGSATSGVTRTKKR
jgi:hypothetical protein